MFQLINACFANMFQLINELNQSVELYCLTESLHSNSSSMNARPGQNKFTWLKQVEPGETYDVPLKVAYHCKLYVAPSDNVYVLFLPLSPLFSKCF